MVKIRRHIAKDIHSWEVSRRGARIGATSIRNGKDKAGTKFIPSNSQSLARRSWTRTPISTLLKEDAIAYSQYLVLLTTAGFFVWEGALNESRKLKNGHGYRAF